ncbi:hypothetical protein [Mesoplasma melaleucae]|uniref:hypothetical protein n=1 Tax=Mesoplasma melaleucae TaxID=81459 RepID=UPI000487293F|nr:hypothetical protein [Mesoplasma melaleucae]
MGNAQRALGSLLGLLGSKYLFNKFNYEKIKHNDKKIKLFKSITVSDFKFGYKWKHFMQKLKFKN